MRWHIISALLAGSLFLSAALLHGQVRELGISEREAVSTISGTAEKQSPVSALPLCATSRPPGISRQQLGFFVRARNSLAPPIHTNKLPTHMFRLVISISHSVSMTRPGDLIVRPSKSAKIRKSDADL